MVRVIRTIQSLEAMKRENKCYYTYLMWICNFPRCCLPTEKEDDDGDEAILSCSRLTQGRKASKDAFRQVALLLAFSLSETMVTLSFADPTKERSACTRYFQGLKILILSKNSRFENVTFHKIRNFKV